jgi:predicted acylesterase/phospholipase RssA
VRADGVFSGGGIKGLAFAGGRQAAAEADYDDWSKLAGTSAGAITAMALAVGYTAQGLRCSHVVRKIRSSLAPRGWDVGVARGMRRVISRSVE